MNPHAAQPASLRAMMNSLWGHRDLIVQMTRREVVGRYKGSSMGLLWSLLNPVFMLVVYSFVFSVVFKARWSGGAESHTQFAVVLFAGMIVHGLFAEVLNRAPSIILANANYVKKVVFPLEILSVVSLGSALFHALVSLLVLLVAFAILNGLVHWTAVFVPLVLMPLMILSLGFGWILSSLGVFVRDIEQVIGVLTTVLLFLSPVFFPISAVPEPLRVWLHLNPLTFFIGQTREVLIWGHLPDWQGLALYFIGATSFAWLGFFWFQKTRKGFSDVL